MKSARLDNFRIGYRIDRIIAGCLSLSNLLLFVVRCTTIKEQYQLNGEIRDREIRVIASNGDMLGVMSSQEALRMAEEESLDLVKISPNATPPVCKIMNYGKFKFEQAKREKENRKNQKIVEMKEIYLSMTIDVGDLNVKAKKALEFLEDGNKVKVSIRMRGRQMAHSSMGVEVMHRFFGFAGVVGDALGECGGDAAA